jgi:hypothetical protein
MPDLNSQVRINTLRYYLTRLQPAGKYHIGGGGNPQWITTAWYVTFGPGFRKNIVFKNSHAAFAYCTWNDTFIRALIKELEDA